jgi:hypothetical protein
MDKNDWDEIIKDDILNCKKMLDDMQIELLKYSSSEAWEYFKPLRYLTAEALSDLYQYKWDRINQVNNIIDDL